MHPSAIYRSEIQAKNFLTYTAQNEKNKIISDIHQNNFILVLSDSRTNVADVEEEAIEVRLLDPRIFKPRYKFLALKTLKQANAESIAEKYGRHLCTTHFVPSRGRR